MNPRASHKSMANESHPRSRRCRSLRGVRQCRRGQAGAGSARHPRAIGWDRSRQDRGIGVEVDLGRQGDLWRGTISIPVQGTKGLPVSDLVVKNPSVEFAIKGAPGDPRFKGELSQDGKTIAGTFSQGGGNVPLNLAWKGEAQFEAVQKNAAVSKALLGTWEGTLDVQGKSLRLVLTLANGPDGATGKLVSLDQNNFEMPVTTIAEEGSRLKLTVSMVSGAFDGEVKGDEIAGTWTQGAVSLPLAFKRAEVTESRFAVRGLAAIRTPNLANRESRAPSPEPLQQESNISSLNHRPAGTVMKLPNLRQGFRLSILAAVVCGSAVFAQSPAPRAAPAGAGQAGQAPAAAGRGQGRGPAFPPVVIGPPAPVPARGRAADGRRGDADQRRPARSSSATDKSAAAPLLKKYESRGAAPAVSREHRRDLHADHAAHGPAARRLRRDAPGRATSTCSCTATRSPTGGCRTTRTRRCSTSTSANIKTANFAVAGDTTQGVLWGLHNGEGQGFQPKAVMLMIGTNNAGGSTAPEIAEGIGAVDSRAAAATFRTRRFCCSRSSREACPATPCATRSRRSTSSSPGSTTRSTCSSWTSGAKFLDEKGVFLPDVFRPDNLHPLAKGYDIWGQAVQAKLAELLK